MSQFRAWYFDQRGQGERKVIRDLLGCTETEAVMIQWLIVLEDRIIDLQMAGIPDDEEDDDPPMGV